MSLHLSFFKVKKHVWLTLVMLVISTINYQLQAATNLCSGLYDCFLADKGLCRQSFVLDEFGQTVSIQKPCKVWDGHGFLVTFCCKDVSGLIV